MILSFKTVKHDSVLRLISEAKKVGGDGVLFVERANELAVRRLVKGVIPGAIVKARVNNPLVEIFGFLVSCTRPETG